MSIQTKISDTLALVDTANRFLSEKRFYAMSKFEQGRYIEFGVYDYETKKYILSNIYSNTREDELNRMKSLLSV